MATARILAQQTGPAANTTKLVNVLSVDTQKNLHKTHAQVGPAGHVPNVMPTFQVAPTGTKGIPTIVVAGFTGPA